MVAGNATYNNHLFCNFFHYYQSITRVLKRNDIVLPEAILEIGSGARPLTALRFLLEGTKRYVASDLLDVQSAFSMDFVGALRRGVSVIDPDLGASIDENVFFRDGDSYRVRGLEAIGGRSFDSIENLGQFAFVHSTSVLEHVQDPRSSGLFTSARLSGNVGG